MNNSFYSTFHYGSVDAIRLLLILIFGSFLLVGIINYLIKWRVTVSIEKYQIMFKDLIIKHLESDRGGNKYEWQPAIIPLDDFTKFDLGRKSIRSALVHTILEFFASSSDQKRASLRKLYKDLDLELYTIIELKTLKGNDLALAIRELAEMGIFVEKGRMREFLKHRSPMIRNTAKTYFQKIYFAKKVKYAME